MAKTIKRVTLIFFVLVISCLLGVGSILALRTLNVKDNSTNLNNKMNLDFQTTADKSFSLPGTFSENEKIWNEAVKFSIDNSGVNVNVKLENDWIAQDDSNRITSFGSSTYFSNGQILVPAGATITLDLNGCTIDRRLITTDGVEYGRCLIVLGKLNILDSKYEPSLVSTLDTIDKIKNAKIGKITGAYNATNDQGSAIFVSGYATLNFYSGIVYNNIHRGLGSNAGAIAGRNGAILNIYDGLIAFNTQRTTYSSAISVQFGVTLNLYGGIIRDNIGGYAAVTFYTDHYDVPESKITIGAGVQIYGNKTELGEDGKNLYLTKEKKIYFAEPLYKKEVGVTHIGISVVDNYPSEIFTENYADFANGYSASKFFFSDDSTKKIANDVQNGRLVSGTERTKKLTWSWNGSSAGSTQNANFAVPYTGKSYNLSCSIGEFIDENNVQKSSFSVSEVGTYVFRTNDNGTYINSMFMFTIGTPNMVSVPSGTIANKEYMGSEITCDNPSGFSSKKMIISGNRQTNAGSYVAKVSLASNRSYWSNGTISPLEFNWEITPKPITKPTISSNNVFVYEEDTIHEYRPNNFDSNTMLISNNKQMQIGKYNAKVTPDSNHKWEDGIEKEELEFAFEIIHPGVVIMEKSGYEYIYLGEDKTRYSYSINNYIHRVTDNEIATINGTTRYVIGNIPVNTTLTSFISNIRNESKLIKVYNSQGNKIFDGIESNGIIADSLSNSLVGTGYKVELYEENKETVRLDIVYLSVLGDINGDGRITASDVAEVREVAENSILLNSMPLEKKLACMVDNKGSVTYVDSEILRNTINNQLDINLFFESGVNVDSEYKYLTLDKDNLIRSTSETQTNVIGNISVNTSVTTFKEKLAVLGIDTTAITIYDRKGIVVTDDNAIVGTGWSIVTGGKTIYLSVIGDLNGDGRITATDITMLRELVTKDITGTQDCILLSAIVLNKSGITTADAEILRCVIDNKLYIERY